MVNDCQAADTSFDFRMQTSPAIPPAMVASLYPNPATDEFTLEYPGLKAVDFRLHYVSGQVVYQGRGGAGKHTLNCSYLLPGMYIASLHDEKGRAAQLKVLIQR